MAKSQKTPRSSKRTYILFIEDEPLIIRQVRREIRQTLGNDILLVVATNLEQAHEELTSGTMFGVVLFDYSLPDGNTIELIKETRRQLDRGIWLLSTTDQPSKIAEMQDAGCRLHVSKKMIAWSAVRLLGEYLLRH